MQDKRTLIIACIVVSILFLIEANLSILLNLISGDLEEWYSGNRTLVVIITVVLVAIGAVLVTINTWLTSRKAENVTSDKKESPSNEMSILGELYEAHKKSPGDKVSSEKVCQGLGLPEQYFIDLIKKLEERGFVKATWLERKALLSITEDGIALIRDN